MILGDEGVCVDTEREGLEVKLFSLCTNIKQITRQTNSPSTQTKAHTDKKQIIVISEVTYTKIVFFSSLPLLL